MEQGPGLYDNDFLLAGETGDDNVTAVAISVPQKRTFIDQYFTRTKKNKGTGAIEVVQTAHLFVPAQKFPCPSCNKECKNAGALAVHVSMKHPVAKVQFPSAASINKTAKLFLTMNRFNKMKNLRNFKFEWMCVLFSEDSADFYKPILICIAVFFLSYLFFFFLLGGELRINTKPAGLTKHGKKRWPQKSIERWPIILSGG